MLDREEVERRLEDMKNADARNAVLYGETQDCDTCEHCDKSAGEVPCVGCYLGSGLGLEWVSARKVVIHEREREVLQTAQALYAERDAQTERHKGEIVTCLRAMDKLEAERAAAWAAAGAMPWYAAGDKYIDWLWEMLAGER